MASTSKQKRNQREKSICCQYFNCCEQITAIIGELSSFTMLHFSLTKKVKVTEFKDTKEAVGGSATSKKPPKNTHTMPSTWRVYHLTFTENNDKLQAVSNKKIMGKLLKNKAAQLVTHSIQSVSRQTLVGIGVFPGRITLWVKVLWMNWRVSSSNPTMLGWACLDTSLWGNLVMRLPVKFE